MDNYWCCYMFFGMFGGNNFFAFPKEIFWHNRKVRNRK